MFSTEYRAIIQRNLAELAGGGRAYGFVALVDMVCEYFSRVGQLECVESTFQGTGGSQRATFATIEFTRVGDAPQK